MLASCVVFGKEDDGEEEVKSVDWKEVRPGYILSMIACWFGVKSSILLRT